MSKRDTYQEVTDRIIRLMDEHGSNWMCPWRDEPGRVMDSSVPVNVASKKAYRGVNIPLLWSQGYASGLWGTYKQWQAKGAQVQRGERSTGIIFWQFKDVEERREDGTKERKRIGLLRSYNVFNVAQVEGYEPPETKPETPAQLHAKAESYVAATGANIKLGGNDALYSPGLDRICCPRPERFKDMESYYGTLLHELTHWTGPKQRCDRNLTGRFGSEAYAAEELVAEMGAAFQCATLGISAEPRADHAKYLNNWLWVLQNDKRAIFTAASKAQQACDYMASLQPDAESVTEAEPDQVAA